MGYIFVMPAIVVYMNMLSVRKQCREGKMISLPNTECIPMYPTKAQYNYTNVYCILTVYCNLYLCAVNVSRICDEC